MKRAELEVGKAYYLDTKADWSSKYLYRCHTTAQAALYLKPSHRVVIVETQLKTDYDRKYRQREVLVMKSNGQEKWIPLNHIRGEYASCIKTICQWSLFNEGTERARKYQKHLQRKQEREVYKPAYEAAMKALKEFGGYVSSYDRVEHAFKIEHLIAIAEGLALLKTQKPELKVAS